MKLSPREREIVDLVGGEQLTYPEVGERLGIATSTVKVYVYRIRDRSDRTAKPRAILTKLHYEARSPMV